MIIKTPDGRTRYYYYKKKRGRKKKRGPKPKKKVEAVVVKKEPKIKKYRVCMFDKKRQVGSVKNFYTAAEAIKYKQELLKENEKVEFPVRYRYADGYSGKQIAYDREYVILKKITNPDDERVTQIRNEYGKLVDHITTSENWQVYDKFPCLKEARFWVYGHGTSRELGKTYRWIVDNLITYYAESTNDYIRIVLFGNKLIIQYTPDDFELVFCINVNDGKRLYNKILEECGKYKNIIFMGMLRQGSTLLTKFAHMVQKKTQWPMERVYRKTTK